MGGGEAGNGAAFYFTLNGGAQAGSKEKKAATAGVQS